MFTAATPNSTQTACAKRLVIARRALAAWRRDSMTMVPALTASIATASAEPCGVFNAVMNWFSTKLPTIAVDGPPTSRGVT